MLKGRLRVEGSTKYTALTIGDLREFQTRSSTGERTAAMPDPADRVAARLAEIRERIERSRQAIDLYGRDVALGEQLVLALEVPVLLSVVDAVLVRHQPKTISYTTLCTTHWRVPHLLADRAQADACPDCLTVQRQVCRSCRHECPDDDTWPCDEYQDIICELLGQEVADA